MRQDNKPKGVGSTGEKRRASPTTRTPQRMSRAQLLQTAKEVLEMSRAMGSVLSARDAAPTLAHGEGGVAADDSRERGSGVPNDHPKGLAVPASSLMEMLQKISEKDEVFLSLPGVGTMRLR